MNKQEPQQSEDRTPEASLPGVLPLLAMSLRLYRKHVRIISGYLAWLLLPLVLTVVWYLGALSLLEVSDTAAALFDFVVNGLLFTLLILWSMTILILLVPAWHAGKTLRLELLGSVAWHFVPSVLYVTLVTTILSLIGFIAFIIPGLIIGVWLSFAAVIIILRQSRLLDALKQSHSLVRGRLRAIFWREYAAGALMLTVYLAFYLGVLAIVWVIDPTGFLTFENLPLFAEILLSLFEIVIFPIGVIYQVLLYLELVKLDQNSPLPSRR